MKRCLSILLVLVMVFCLQTAVFAAEEPKTLDQFLGEDLGKDYGLGPCGFDLDGLVEAMGGVEDLTIGVAVNNLKAYWPKQWSDEFAAMADQYGFEAVILNANNEEATEAENFATLRSLQVDGICVSPIGQTIAQTESELYGIIPVVNCIPVQDAQVSTTLRVDQEAKGAMLCDHVAEDFGDQEVYVMTVNTSLGMSQMDARIKGFTEQAEKYDNITIVSEIIEGTADAYLDMCKASLLANPEVNCIVGSYSEPMLGGYNAVDQLGLIGEVSVYGIDANQTTLEWLRDGKLAGMHVQFAAPQAAECLFYCLAAIGGYEVPEEAWECDYYAMYYAKPEDAEFVLDMWGMLE